LADGGGLDPHAVADTICFQNSDGSIAGSPSLLVVTPRLERGTSTFGQSRSSN
jgi:hypothetical protein